METLTTTPHDFIWRVKNPQDYWANTHKEVKCIVEVNGIVLGKFNSINRSFDDDRCYVNFYDINDNLEYCSVDSNSEMILRPIEGEKNG